MMVELQLIKFNKMAEKQRWRRLRSKIWRYILKTILYTFNPWLTQENVTTSTVFSRKGHNWLIDIDIDWF